VVEDFLHDAAPEELEDLEEALQEEPLLRGALAAAYVDADANPVSAAWLARHVAPRG